MSLLAKLVDILNNEYEHYQKLLTIAKKKKETLIENNVEELLEHIKDDRSIIREIEELEEKREVIIEKTREKYKINNDDLRYSQMIEKLPDEWQKKLSSIRSKLLAVIEEFHTQNEQNRDLLEEAMRLNEFSLNMIMDNIDVEWGTYNNKDESAPHLLDKRG